MIRIYKIHYQRRRDYSNSSDAGSGILFPLLTLSLPHMAGRRCCHCWLLLLLLVVLLLFLMEFTVCSTVLPVGFFLFLFPPTDVGLLLQSF